MSRRDAGATRTFADNQHGDGATLATDSYFPQPSEILTGSTIKAGRIFILPASQLYYLHLPTFHFAACVRSPA